MFKKRILFLLIFNFYILNVFGAEKKQDGQWYSFARHLVVLIRDRVSKMTSNLDFDRNFSDGTKNGFLSKLKVVFPGTLWCGDGNVSDSVAVLGSAKFADSCCRDHDMCPDTIEAGDTQHGLTNKGLFTRSHCDCDDKFYNCLKKANTLISNGIGFTYFTILGPQCFQEDYPIIDCEDKQSNGRCRNYKKKENQEKVYEWFDNPIY